MVLNDWLFSVFVNFWFVTVLTQNIKMTFRQTPLLTSKGGREIY